MTHLLHFVSTLLLLRLCSPARATSAATDAAALAALKAAIIPSTIPPFSYLASWNFSAAGDPCRNFQCGISCSADGRVTAIALDPAGYSDSFSGPIPFTVLSYLTSLQTLELSGNSFSGTIPASLSCLSALAVLDLSCNRLTGSISSSLPPNLVTLALRGNSLAGSLTRSAFEPLRRLEVADLAGNHLGGKLEGWLLGLPKIQQVNLANNSLDKWEVWPAAASTGEGRSW